MATEKKVLLYEDPTLTLAAELVAQTPELEIRGGDIYIKGLQFPIATVPEDLIYDLPIHPNMVTPGATYTGVAGWGKRRAFERPTRVVMDTELQMAKDPSVVANNLKVAVKQLVPGGVYIAQLTEQGGKGLRADPLRKTLIAQFGQPEHQYRVSYPNPEQPTVPARAWFGVWRKQGGRTPAGPIPSRATF